MESSRHWRTTLQRNGKMLLPMGKESNPCKYEFKGTNLDPEKFTDKCLEDTIAGLGDIARKIMEPQIRAQFAEARKELTRRTLLQTEICFREDTEDSLREIPS